jgi:hypothetical protein
MPTIMEWLRGVNLNETIELVLSWPSVTLIALLLVTHGRLVDQLTKLFQPFRSVKLFGATFILEEGAARQAREQFAAFRDQVKAEFELEVDRHRVRHQLEAVAREVIEPYFKSHLDGEVRDYRCTVHVEDVLFDESLFQLVDDFPRGGGRGQLKSIRFGLIGWVWRRQEPKTHAAPARPIDDRMDEWGMTLSEAEMSGRGKKLFSGTLLRDSTNTPIAVFYLDSSEELHDPGDNWASLHATVEDGCRRLGLTASIEAIISSLRGRSPRIPLYD